jgi:adenosine kinase
MDSEKLVFAIGNPLLDISVDSTEETLTKYGLNKGLACLAEEKHKALFEEIWADEKHLLIPGGSAMNVLRSANFMVKATKPNSCLYYGSIAEDERGLALKAALDNEHIEYDFSITDETYTGACAVVVTENERSLCADLAACLKYKTEHLDTHIDRLKDYKIIYTTGFFITSNPEALKKVAAYAADHKITMGFNLSATFLVEGCKDLYNEIIPYVNIVFGNEDECDSFGKAHGIESTDRKEIAKHIAQIENKNATTTRTVIIHQGSQDTIVATHNFESGETDVATFVVEQLTKAEIVDTNSAGDSFAGGYLGALALGHTHTTCMKAAGYTARYILQTPGCQFLTANTFEYPQL